MQEARKKALRLGYNKGYTNWERKEYEEQRRDLLNKKRIEKEVKEEETETKKYELPRMEWDENMWEDNDYCPF